MASLVTSHTGGACRNRRRMADSRCRFGKYRFGICPWLWQL